MQYLHPNGTGSVGAVTNSSNARQATYAYEPFGAARTSPTNQDNVANPIRFGGEYLDGSTGRYNLRARDYDPDTGRFSQLDPVAQDLNDPFVGQYVYANNQPTVLLDPSGQCIAGFGLVCKAGEVVAGGATAIWDSTTNHVGGCASQDVSECGGLFLDLVSLGGIESAGHDLTGCADRQLSSCGMLFVDLVSLGLVYGRPIAAAATGAVTTARAGLTATGGAVAALCRSALDLLTGLRTRIPIGAPRLSNALADTAANAAARTSRYTRTTFGGNRVYQRSDLIDPAAVDKLGRTNLERMQSGIAPLGPDGRSINLHHLTQRPNGAIAEITATMHQTNSRVLHINPNTVPSGIDRGAFDAWRRSYWKTRAGDF